MKPRAQPRGLLDGLAPEAFETWVGDRFRELGYDVRVTPFQGDHGADLIVTRAGMTTVVQCKHHPAGAVGEPVLRDLFGAMHHFGAMQAILVTTGRVTPAARAWLQDKPIEAWDAAALRGRWAVEIAQTTEQLAAAAPPISPDGADYGGRSGWYVYTGDGGRRYALKLPRSVGDHPALGFEPLADPGMPALPQTIKVRHVNLATQILKRQRRTVPIGSKQAMRELGSIDLTERDGTTATYSYRSHAGECQSITRRTMDVQPQDVGTGADRAEQDTTGALPELPPIPSATAKPTRGWVYMTDRGYEFVLRTARYLTEQVDGSGTCLVGGRPYTISDVRLSGTPGGFKPRTVTVVGAGGRREVVCFSNGAPLYTGARTSIYIRDGGGEFAPHVRGSTHGERAR